MALGKGNLKNMKRTSNSYKSLSRIGARATRNVKTIPVTMNVVGINITQEQEKRAVNLELVVPTTRTNSDSRRVAKLNLNGRQARQLYETLQAFYMDTNARF